MTASKNTLWTVSWASYECARDIIRSEDYEDFAPFGVYSSRDKAVEAVLKCVNQNRADCRECDDEDTFPGMSMYEDMTADDIVWWDVPTYQRTRLRWKFHDEIDESFYILAEYVLDDADEE